MASKRTSCLILGTVFLAALIPCFAQDQKRHEEEAFWEVRQRQEAGAAAQLVLVRDPISAAFVREIGFRRKIWREPEFLGDRAPALNAEWLEELHDGTPTPTLRGKADDELRKDQRAYVKVFSQALIFAHDTPADAFAKSAEEHAEVTFAHLWRDPSSYRGKVIPITGRLARVRIVRDVPSEARERGVATVYEGWIFGPTRHSHPFWVVFTTLPDGLAVAEEMDHKVSFAGYFLKKIKYAAGDGSKSIETPLLVGPTVTLVHPPAEIPSTPVSVTAIVCVVVVIVVVAIGLTLVGWYFHRGDEAVKKRLAMMQGERAALLLDDAAPEGSDESPRVNPSRQRPQLPDNKDFN